MRQGSLKRQDGFIREVLWVTLAVVIAAIVVLDGVSLYSAYERVRKDTDDAARQAHQTHVQTLDVKQASRAARALLEDRGDDFVDLKIEGSGESTVFIVSAKRHVDTYAFRYLRHVPSLDGWVAGMLNPAAIGRSD